MNLEELRRLADSFFEWPTGDRSHVTLTSALLFAQHVLRMAQQQAEPQRVTMAHMDALHKAIDHVASLQNDRLRFQSACEISGEKHPEYVRGYEAAIDAVCMTKQAGEPVAWEFQHEDTGLIDFVDPQQVEWGFEKNNPRWQKIGPVYRWHAQAQPDGEIVVTWDESQTRIIAVTRQDAEGKVLSVIAEAQPAPIPTAWQPIETAPKDGSLVLLAVPSFNDFESNGAFVTVGSHNGFRWKDDSGDLYEPVGWMPIPLPPAPGGE